MSYFDRLFRLVERFHEMQLKMVGATTEQAAAVQNYWNGVFRYVNEFMEPYWASQASFRDTEKDKLAASPPWETVKDYIELLHFNLQIAEKGLLGSLSAMNDFYLRDLSRSFTAWLNTIFSREGEDIDHYISKRAKAIQTVVLAYPQAIREIKPEFGFHFERKGYLKVAETDRFFLYQVLPSDRNVEVRKKGKPIIILPSYVLGPNILAFLPGENRSYVHCFANQGIPTYVRIVKDIDATPAVQLMTGEDEVLDTRAFCRSVMERHDRPVTLHGYCQGGFVAMVDLLSGKLDGFVDALITCVAPMDGTRSKALTEYIQHLPPRFRDMGYALKTLATGNQVVDGTIMSWVYKLKSMETDAPIVAFYRDLMMVNPPGNGEMEISRTAAALNHWLIYDRRDLPQAIIKMSFDSYTIPVGRDGTLPVSLFGRKLNFKRLQKKRTKILICYAEKDDLVNKEAALAPLDYIDAEVCVFPKGHGGIATSWSHPDSEFALHRRFPNNSRGPVRYQLDLEEEG